MTQPPRKKLFSPLTQKLADVRSIHDTQRLYIRNELIQAKGLLPTLMKRRNGEKWTPEERKKLQRDLRALTNLSPYLIPLILPGGIFMLPILAWWLDSRRRARERKAPPES
ncbi:MAG: hypothetical protein R8K20_05855 [Gallionellaceae bacterium]